MKIEERKFPILECIENNKLTDKVLDMLDNSGFDANGILNIKPSFDYFKNKSLQINYISAAIHKKLSETKNFINIKSLLVNSPETTGLLILPESIFPDFSNVPDYVKTDSTDYPINAILYSWLSYYNHDKISNKSQLENLKQRISAGEKPPPGTDWNAHIKSLENEDDIWDEGDNNRYLLIIPIHNERITQATDQSQLTSNNEIYGWEYSEREGRAWYGKIHDYVMSFILFHNFKDVVRHFDNGYSWSKN